jgi:Protein of unknown function (DUF3892)
MVRRQIICITKVEGNHAGHPHIVSIQTPHGVTGTLEQATKAILTDADEFYTVSPTTGGIAEVEAYFCDECQHDVLRSSPDDDADNNLRRLPDC